jgi:hypothetical protein
LAVDGDAVWVVDSWPPLDVLAHSTLDRIGAESGLPVGTWLEFLGRDAVDRVSDRLVRAGGLVREESSRWGRTSVRYVPVDPARAAWPGVRLWSAVDRGAPFEGADGFLAGLVLALGLGWQVFRDAGPRARDRVAAEVEGLPAPLGDLVEQVPSVAAELPRMASTGVGTGA